MINRDKDQLMIFSKADLGLIKATFADNEELLYLIRKVMFQYPLEEEEKRKIKASMSESVWKVLKKRFQLEIIEELPLGQSIDLLFHLGNELKTKSMDEVELLFNAKVTEITYLNQQLNYLKDIDQKLNNEIVLSDLSILVGKKAEEAFVGVTARNYIISCVETNLVALKNAAGLKEETPEEQEKRMTRNSSK